MVTLISRLRNQHKMSEVTKFWSRAPYFGKTVNCFSKYDAQGFKILDLLACIWTRMLEIAPMCYIPERTAKFPSEYDEQNSKNQ